MPYERYDDDDESAWLEEDAEGGPHPTGSFEYVAINGHFDPEKSDGPAALIYRAVVDAGGQRFRVRYDGGHDEGFAHADAVWFGDGSEAQSVVDLSRRWASSPLVERIGTAVRERHPNDFHHTTYAFRPAPEQWVDLAFCELAEAVVSALLGDGYGTGEYSLYGACVLDLATGEITDDPAVPMPPDLD